MSFRLEIQSRAGKWLSCEEITGFATVAEIEEGVNEVASQEHTWAGAYRVVDEQTGAVAKEFVIAPPPACDCGKPCANTITV